MDQKARKVLSFFFFVYGIYSVFSMQRDFRHTTRLTIFLLALVPIFLLLNLVGKISTRHAAHGRTSPRLKAANWFSQWLTQNMTQYILMFCLPFFVISQSWIYLAVTLVLLATTLWDSWWKRLLPLTLYRQLLRLWSVLCAGSFLIPFLWPQRLHDFYFAMAAAAALALLPTQLDRIHLISSGLLEIATLLNLLVFPLSWRFPVLSVWVEKPHFATNEDNRDRGVDTLPPELSVRNFQTILHDASSICCVAPVVAPPGVRERVTQEWTIDSTLIERPELKSIIQGSEKQKSFHSFFCKHNFPPMSANHTLRCRLSLQDAIFLGEARLTLP